MTVLIALVLTVTMLAACSGGSVTDVKNAPADFPPSTVVLEEQSAPVTYEVTLETLEDTALDEDGTELAGYCFRVPRLAAVREDGSVITQAETSGEEQALTAVETFNDQFEDWADVDGTLESLAASRERGSAGVGGNDASFPAYSLTLDCSVYQTEKLISIAAEYYSYTGGAHPNTVLLAWNFDLTTGQFFNSAMLAADGQEFLAVVRDEIIRQAEVPAENDAEVSYWEDYQDIVADWDSYAVSFDEDGMRVAFSPYEIACYAAGPQIFELSYGFLQPLLSEHGIELLQLDDETQK